MTDARGESARLVSRRVIVLPQHLAGLATEDVGPLAGEAGYGFVIIALGRIVGNPGLNVRSGGRASGEEGRHRMDPIGALRHQTNAGRSRNKAKSALRDLTLDWGGPPTFRSMAPAALDYRARRPLSLPRRSHSLKG